MSSNLERKADEIRRAVEALKSELSGIRSEIHRVRQDANSPTERIRDQISRGEERRRERILGRRLEVAEDASFWGRRFVTSITLGNAAGLFGVASYVANSNELAEAGSLAFAPFATFLVGTLLGAMQPAAESWKAERTVAYLDAQLERTDEDQLKAKELAAKNAALLAGRANAFLFSASILALIAGTAQVLWAMWPHS